MLSIYINLNADPEVIKYTGDRPFSSVDDARIFIQNYDHYSRFGYGRWAVLTEASTFLGWCGLRNDGMGNVDLGFRIFRSYWSQGIATECGHALPTIWIYGTWITSCVWQSIGLQPSFLPCSRKNWNEIYSRREGDRYRKDPIV